AAAAAADVKLPAKKKKTVSFLLRIEIADIYALVSFLEGGRRKRENSITSEKRYGIHLDAEGGKVTVTGNVAPAVLITKLRKAGKIAELLHPKIGNQQKNTQIVKSQKGGGGGGEGPKWYKNLKFPRFKNLKLPFKKEKEVVEFDILPKEESGDVKKKTGGGGGGEGVGVQVQNKGGTTSPVTIIHGGAMSPEMTAGGNPYHHPQQQRMTMMNGGQDSVGYGYGHAEYVPPPPPPQEVSYSTTMFSDENPNNCSVM
ncbi:hypothetical protein BHM03_00061081, partial [Ensete ventricosum]